MAKEEEVLRLFGGFAFPGVAEGEARPEGGVVRELGFAAVPDVVGKEAPRTKEEKEEWLYEQGWERLYDLLTREWPQVEALKGRAEKLKELADNEQLFSLKRLYDEQADRFKEVFVERWDVLYQILQAGLENITYFVTVLIPALQRIVPPTAERVKINLPVIIRASTLGNPSWYEELRQELLREAEWLRMLVERLSTDIARLIVQTYPIWSEGVWPQVLDDVIRYWWPSGVEAE